jgi:hypothetical protein
MIKFCSLEVSPPSIQMMNLVIPLGVTIGCLAIGCLSIVAACYHWVRNQLFGTAGIVLSTVGLLLLGASIWAAVDMNKRANITEVQRIIENGNEKTIAAVRESNKQLADQLPQLRKLLQNDQERALTEIQKHILAIRVALAERERPASTPQQPAQPQQPAPAGRASGEKPKRQPAKTR